MSSAAAMPSPPPPLLHASLAHAPGRPRPGSGRNAGEIRCQNPDCAAVLDVTAIPVEYEGACVRGWGRGGGQVRGRGLGRGRGRGQTCIIACWLATGHTG